MTTQSQSLQSARPVKERIMRWLGRGIFLAFLVVSLVGVAIIWLDTLQNFRNDHQVALVDVQAQFDDEIEAIGVDLRAIGVSNTLQQYGAQVTRAATLTEDLQQRRDEALSQFEALLASQSAYQSVRFLEGDGTVRLSASRTDQGLTSSTDIQRSTRDPQTDPALTRGRNSEYGSVSLVDVQATTDESGQADSTRLTFVVAVPIPDDANNSAGIIELEVDGTQIFGVVRSAPQSVPMEAATDRRFALLDSSGRLLADSATSPGIYLPSLDATTPTYPQADADLLAFIAGQPNRFHDFWRGTSAIPVTSGSAPTMPWQLAIIESPLSYILRAALLSGLIVVSALLAGTGVIFYASRRLSGSLRNIEQASNHIQALARGERGAATQPGSGALPAEEDERMVAAAASLEQQLIDLNQRIETQSQRYERNLRVAARISRETALLDDIDQLLNRALNLISTSFGLYHAQVFLTDDANLNAVLVYSQGEAGRQLMEKGHKLPIGSQSVIGQVTETGEPVIVNDTQAERGDSTHAFNPILDRTRAEMALPLQIGEMTIGALDLQSDQPHAFDPDELETYQLLADQIAIAVYKTQLLRQSDERVRQIEKLNRQLTQLAWEELEEEAGLDQAYRYDLLSVETGQQARRDPYQSNHMLSVPIRIRGHVVGTINATPPPTSEFTQNDGTVLQAVAQRIALAVENARLFQETQSNLSETATLYQTSRSLSGVETMAGVIEAIIASAMPGASSGQILVLDEYDEYEEAANEDEPLQIEVVASWANEDRYQGTTDPQKLVGTHFDADPGSDLVELLSNKVTLIENVDRDTRLGDDLRSFYQQLGAQAAVCIPLTVRGTWRGTVIVEFPQPRAFAERDGRIFENLVDTASVSIENLLLLRQTEDALSQNERLYAASRIINQARNMEDLVRAAVATTDALDLNFGLALFEGELDETGWSLSLQHVAQSQNAGIYHPQKNYEITVVEESPLRERLPVAIDASAPANLTQQILAKLIRSNNDNFATVFPLFAANQPLALFIASRKSAEPISEENKDIYRALTGQMSTVIQNRRLLSQTATALDETRRLYEASRAITTAQDMTSVYDAALQHLAPPLGDLARMSVMLAGPEYIRNADHLEVAYSWSRHEREMPPLALGTRYDSDEYSLIEAALNQEESNPFHVPNTERDLVDFPTVRQFFQQQGTASLVMGVMQSRQNWLGIVLMESRQTNAFDEQYIRFVRAVTNQIAVALENQILFEQAQQEARQAIALAEASQLTNQIGGELRTNFNPLFARVAETAGYDRWLLMLLHEPSQQLQVVTQQAPSGGASIAPDTLNLNTADHSIADTLLYNRTLIINEPLSYPAFQGNEDIAQTVGKHIATPIITGGKAIGSLIVGRALDEPDLTERDETLVTTMAAQVAITIENQRLFAAAESERRNLLSIIDTLPAGVLVLDAKTLQPIQYNEQITDFIPRRVVEEARPFSAEEYGLIRTGTELSYPNEELPVLELLETGTPTFSDDVSIINPDGRKIDMLVNAAPITDGEGNIVSIVAAFEDISNLRGLENTLQDNLRETISLYEATRSLSEADELDEVLDVVLFQLIMNEPEDAHIVIVDPQTSLPTVSRSMGTPIQIEGLSQAVLSQERVIMIDNVQSDAGLGETDRVILRQQGIEAIASVPLRVRSRSYPLGWIIIDDNQPKEFTSEDERFLSTLGDNAAVAIDNRYLFESTQRALQDTVSLYNVTATISRARSLTELSRMMQVALEELSPDIYAAFLMPNASSPDDLEVLFNINLDGPEVDFQSLLLKYNLFRDESIFIEDLEAIDEPTPLQQALLSLGIIRGIASVSLRIKNMPDGRIFIAYHAPHVFTDAEARFLSAISDSASVIVDNILLLDQIQNALEETSTLYQASRALANATTASGILDVVVEKLVGPYVEQAFVGLLATENWDVEGASVEVIKSWQAQGNIDLEGTNIRADQFPAWDLLATPNVVTIDDIKADAYLNEVQQQAVRNLGAGSVAVIPLRVPKRPIGVIWISSPEPHEHNEREQRVYQAFAEQASLSLEAAFLLSQTERRARQLSTSNQVSQIASSILDLDELLPRVVTLVREQFGYDHVQVFLMDRDDEYAVLRASTAEPGRHLLHINHQLAKGSQSVIGQVTKLAEPVIALDTAEADVIHYPNPFLPLTRSEMALPIILKGRVIGALDVQSNEPGAFGDEDISVLTTLAAQLSVAIDNARLFNQSERRADEMSFLFTIATAAASADTLQDALQRVSELLLTSRLETQAVGIYLSEAAQSGGPTWLSMVALAGSEQPLSGIEDIRLDDTDNPISRAAEQATPMIVEDTRADEHYLPLTPDARSAVVVPMTEANTIVGIIVLESEQTRVYNQDTLTLLLALQSTLSAIVINARLLEEVEQQRDELFQLDKLKSQFLANMSHELRTPLNSIIGFSRVMLKGIDGELTDMQEQDLTTIYNSGQHLLSLINAILDEAKISADKMTLETAYFDVRGVVEGVRSIGIGLVKEKPVEMLTEIANNLPDAYGDEFRTRQVLLNLVSNAAKFTDQGTVTMSLYAIEDEEHGTMLRVDVTDTGIGIAEKDLPTLFEAFRQVDSSLTRSAEGTGLGLRIARSLVEIQGGDMFVESEPGVGSIFSVTIPTQPVEVDVDDIEGGVIDEETDAAAISLSDGLSNGKHTDAQQPADVTTRQPTTKKDTQTSKPPKGLFKQKRQILLIEDNPQMVDQYRRLLQREGFEVQVASDAFYAQTMASGLRPTLIIIDVDFADGAGWDVLKDLKDRDDTFDIPVIVVTMNADSERIYRLGAYHYVQRPYTPQDFMEIVLDAEGESNVARVLIIDDQPQSTRLIEQVLEEYGKYRVFAAHTGQEGISLVARRQPDLIVLDLRMPEMDGFAVLEELKSRPETAAIPVMIVTGETTFEDDEREKLTDLEIIYKTDLNEDNYQDFIDEVRRQISSYQGK